VHIISDKICDIVHWLNEVTPISPLNSATSQRSSVTNAQKQFMKGSWC